VKCFSQLEFSSVTSTHTEFLDSFYSLVVFEKVSKALIHQLKYKSVKEIAVVCARMMYMYGSFPPSHVITCIPLHRKRFSQRGYNQAEEIARELSRLLGVTYLNTLQRIVHTQNLASISDPEERKNVISGQFTTNHDVVANIQNKNIMIVDDVWTTGSTLEEAARILKSAGAAQVLGVTFAHGA
jgi:competence protein ComFC